MKAFIITATILMLVTACGGHKNIVATASVTDTLTVVRRIVERETSFKTDTARVYVSVPMFKILRDTIIKQNKNARVIIKQIRDTLRITATCDSLEIRAKIKDELIHEIQNRVEVKTIIQKERYTPWPVKALAWCGGVGLGLIGLKTVFKNSLPI